MRDGVPVVALAVSIVAAIIALSGLVSSGPEGPEEAPEEVLKNAERRLMAIEQKRRAMRKEMADIAAQAARAIELGGRSAGPQVDTADLEDRVKLAVDVAMRTRLGEEAKRVGAPPPKATAQDSFNDMLQEMEKALKLDARKAGALRNTLNHLRGELNRIFRAHKGADREKQARLIRSRTEASLRKVLSPAEFDTFDKWRKGSKNGYVKRFFGL